MKKTITGLAFAAVVCTCGASPYVIQPGTPLTVTDASNSSSSYPDGISFADATCELHLNTSEPPKMAISGTGVIRKVSEDDWDMNGHQLPNFKGKYYLEGGVVSVYATKMFGVNPSLYVQDGATLSFAGNALEMGWTDLHIAGRGKNGRGAVEVTSAVVSYWDTRIIYLTLDADALLTMDTTSLPIRNISLGGHNLEIAGRGGVYQSYSLSGEGDIILRKTGTSALTYYLRGPNVSVSSSATHGFVLTGGTSLTITGNVPEKPNRPIFVSGTGNTLSLNDVSAASVTTTNGFGWAGNISFTNETGVAELRICQNAGASSHLFSIMGEISGNGKVVFPSYGVKGKVFLGGRNNTFNGGLEIGEGTIVAACPTSIPDFNAITVDVPQGYSAALEMALDPDGTGWTYAKAVELANKSCWTALVYPKFTSVPFGADPAPIAYDPTAVLTSGRRIGSVSPAPIFATSDGTAYAHRWTSGTLVLTGANAFSISGTELSASETLDYTKGTQVLRVENGRVSAGPTANRVKSGLELEIASGGRWLAVNPQKSSHANGLEEALVVGDYGTALVRISDGAVVSNRFTLGGTGEDGSSGSGFGAVLQSGGNVVLSGGSAINKGACHIGYSNAAAGYYEQSGGVIESHGAFIVGLWGTGVFAQYGGELLVTNCYDGTAVNFYIGSAAAGSMFVGGKTRIVSSTMSINTSGTVSDLSNAVLTVSGPAAEFRTVKGISANGGRDGLSTCVNVTGGGLLQAPFIRQTRSPSVASLCVNFDDGTFVCGADDTDSFAATHAPTGVYIYDGGMTVDTDGHTGNSSSAPLSGATGRGIASITLSTPCTSVGGAPYVIIEGDGSGASAFAKYDDATHSVSEIVVTSPGVGYTTAACKLYVRKVCICTLTSGAGEIAFADNANTGSFVKTGAGDYTLNAANTWGGSTVVAGGVLRAGCNNAIPAGTDLVLSGGGVLDLDGKAANISSVSYGVGGGAIRNASAATLPASATMTISFDDIVAGRTIALEGNVDLSKIELTVVGDVPELDPERIGGYKFVTVSGGVCTGKPSIVSAALPNRWAFVASGRGVSLKHQRGMRIIFR